MQKVRSWLDVHQRPDEESVGGVGRFLLENVEASPGDPFIPKRGDQRFLVNDRAARDIDEIGGRLHQCETSRIQQMPRLLVEKARDDDKVRALHQLFKAAEFNADISCGRRTDMGIGRQGFVTPAVACWMYVRAVAECRRKISYAGYRFPPEVIHQATFTLSFGDIEDLLAEGGIAVSYERAPLSEPLRADDRPASAQAPSEADATWHLDEVYLKIDGRMVYLWRAVDAEGEVLDVRVQSKRNKHAALKLMGKLLKKYAFQQRCRDRVRGDRREAGAGLRLCWIRPVRLRLSALPRRTMTIDVFADFLRKVSRDKIVFHNLHQARAGRVPVGPGAVIDDDRVLAVGVS